MNAVKLGRKKCIYMRKLKHTHFPKWNSEDFWEYFWSNAIWKEHVFAFPSAKVCCLYVLLCNFPGFFWSKLFLWDRLTFGCDVDFFWCVLFWLFFFFLIICVCVVTIWWFTSCLKRYHCFTSFVIGLSCFMSNYGKKFLYFWRMLVESDCIDRSNLKIIYIHKPWCTYCKLCQCYNNPF